MTQYPFDCLVVSSRDTALDRVITAALEDEGHAVEEVPAADLLATLRARSRPTVVVKNMSAPSGQWRRTLPEVVAAPEVTTRFAYVLLTLYHEWVPRLLAELPADHDVTVLQVPFELVTLFDTVERAGTRLASQWNAPQSPGT